MSEAYQYHRVVLRRAAAAQVKEAAPVVQEVLVGAADADIDTCLIISITQH